MNRYRGNAIAVGILLIACTAPAFSVLCQRFHPPLGADGNLDDIRSTDAGQLTGESAGKGK
jgi:hypothetical protein